VIPSARPVRRPVTGVQVLAVDEHGAHRRPDQLVTEEPLELRVHGPGEVPTQLVVTMRTPGNDFELAAGFLRTEGIITSGDDIATIAYCLQGDEQQFNIVTVHLRHPVVAQLATRSFLSTSACGVCGKAALDDIAVRAEPVAAGPVVPASALRALPDTLAEHQRVFGETGGLHAAARFGAGGTLVAVREDVGRHNALVKVLGALARAGRPASGGFVLVTSRASYEMVQKAAMCGVELLAAISRPTGLAIRFAEGANVTLAALVRGESGNVYCHPRRISLTQPEE